VHAVFNLLEILKQLVLVLLLLLLLLLPRFAVCKQRHASRRGLLPSCRLGEQGVRWWREEMLDLLK
jgi:hypothetical protein